MNNPFLLQNTRDFVTRWRNRNEITEAQSDDQCVDRFFTLFVAFNRLYNDIAIASKSGESCDRQRALTVFRGYARIDELLSDLGTQATADQFTSLASQIGNTGNFDIYPDREPGGSKGKAGAGTAKLADDALRKTIMGFGYDGLTAALDVIYGLRCNMFHGDKNLSGKQHLILLPAIGCLEFVLVWAQRRLEDELTPLTP